MSAGFQFLQPWTAGPNKNYSQNKIFNIGEGVLLRWSTKVTNATLSLAQDNFPGDSTGGPFDDLVPNAVTGTTWTWTVTYGSLNPSYNSVYYLTIGDNEEGFATSHYFNISGTETHESSSLSSSTSSSSSTSTTPSSTQLQSSQNSVPPPTQTSASVSNGLSTITNITPTNLSTQTALSKGGMKPGAVGGVAVGSVAGTILLLGALWAAWIFKKRRDKAIVLKAERIARSENGKKFVYEAGGHTIHEMQNSTQHRRFEIDGAEISQ